MNTVKYFPILLLLMAFFPLSCTVDDSDDLPKDPGLVDQSVPGTSDPGGAGQPEEGDDADGNGNVDDNDSTMEKNVLYLTMGDSTFTATLEENTSVQALLERLRQGPLSVRMQDYGDMEKVGNLGFSLPRNDEDITTAPGDIVLYQGNSLVIYYDVNSWSLTRIGKIDGVSTRNQVLGLLGGKGSIEVVLSL